MKSIISAVIVASVALLFFPACAPVGTPETTSDRDENSAGARLYAQYCSACHGNYGRGGVGIPLALDDFLESVSNQYIARTIRLGRPGRVMPSFPRLTDQEVQDITEYVRSFHWAEEPKFSAEPVKGDPKLGARIFIAFCARCHGADGGGGEGTGVSFSRPGYISILAPAINNAGYLASANDQIIKRSLTLGRDQTPMRALSAMGLNEQNINDLVSYIRSFQILSMGPVILKRPTDAVLVQQSLHSYEQTIENIKQAIVNRGYSVVREELLGEGIIDPDEGERRQNVVYFGSLQMLFDGLAHDPRMGLFLPAKITIIEHNGVVKILASNPKQYVALFNNMALNDFAEMLHGTYQAIIKEAAL